MKKLVSGLLAVSLCVPVLAAEGGLQKVNTYTPGQFTDVPADLWCAANVQTAYEYGIMGGKTTIYFDVDSNLTVAQAIVMACRLHSGYVGDGAEFATADPWYQSYVDYAGENGIVCRFDGYDVSVTRGTFAMILSSALPDAALPAISDIEEGAVPDVDAGSTCYDAVYRLYRAGVLTGSDAKGTFYPGSFITRGAAAAIIGRMAEPAQRKAIALEKAPFQPVPISQLQNLASLKKKCTDAEFQEAYDAALAVVTPLADLPREDQLTGIAVAPREGGLPHLRSPLQRPLRLLRGRCLLLRRVHPGHGAVPERAGHPLRARQREPVGPPVVPGEDGRRHLLDLRRLRPLLRTGAGALPAPLSVSPFPGGAVFFPAPPLFGLSGGGGRVIMKKQMFD